jgi:chemotaxis protein histidine kinase CheA
LFEKMDKFKQQSKNQNKSLEQLVELTKKYYVEKKAEQIADKLNKLAEKQDKLAESEKENNTEKQEEINKEFDKIQEELKELEKENNELKAPVDLPETEPKEKSIDEDLKNASDQLQKQQKDKAKPKQKSASKKMKQMSQEMQESMQESAQEQLEEDVEMLRQILDNLLAYSFSQEDVMKQFKGLKRGSPTFVKNLKKQQDLKQQFKHVDDSLFAMSLRNPKIGEQVTKEIGEVQYNVDKALETLAEANVSKGTSHQQFATSASNRLADMLADALNSMQMSMSMSGQGGGKPKPGQGQGSGMQLPDIIKKQEGLGEKMKKGMKPGEKPGEGSEGKEGEKPGGKEGGKQGQGGQGGKDGEGKDGEGKNGKNGKGGNSGGSGQGDSKGGENGKDGEGDAQKIMEIYKEQQQLREALEKELNKQGLGGNGQNALNQMKQIEKQLLNKGFNNEVLQKMLNLKYELLKLEKATQQQGEEKKRQSETNKKEFNNTTNALPQRLQDYINSIEILNRQTLPLRANFNQKVQEYFKTNDKL